MKAISPLDECHSQRIPLYLVALCFTDESDEGGKSNVQSNIMLHLRPLERNHEVRILPTINDIFV